MKIFCFSPFWFLYTRNYNFIYGSIKQKFIGTVIECARYIAIKCSHTTKTGGGITESEFSCFFKKNTKPSDIPYSGRHDAVYSFFRWLIFIVFDRKQIFHPRWMNTAVVGKGSDPKVPVFKYTQIFLLHVKNKPVNVCIATIVFTFFFLLI